MVSQLEVQFLPVHCPSAQEVADPDLFAAGVQKDIADALGVPCSQYTFEDSWVGGLVLKHGLDPTSCMVQWKTLQRAVSISRDDMKVSTVFLGLYRVPCPRMIVCVCWLGAGHC